MPIIHWIIERCSLSWIKIWDCAIGTVPNDCRSWLTVGLFAVEFKKVGFDLGVVAEDVDNLVHH